MNEPEQRMADAVVPTAAARPQFSPDGRYWWDGYSWQQVTSVAPVVHYSIVPTASKSKVAAGLLAILLGDFGIYKFYLGQVGLGILYLLFCWTFIPGLVGLVEGIIYLTTKDNEWASRYPPIVYPASPA